MKTVCRLALALGLLLGMLPAWSAVSCQVSLNPADVNVNYLYFFAVNTQGSISLNCTAASSDGPRPVIWIGIPQSTTTGRTATLDTGGSTVRYEIDHGSTNGGVWTDTGGVAWNSNNNGAVSIQGDFGPGNKNPFVFSIPFYFSVAAFQFQPAGVYVDSVPITLRQDSSTGAFITSVNLAVHISIYKSCRFSTPPTPIDVNYTAFSPVAVTATSNFALTCTQGTSYTLSLDATRSVVPTVDLAYGLVLSATTGTGNTSAQGYAVTISVDANQPGTCNTSTCTGTDTRTLTVSY